MNSETFFERFADLTDRQICTLRSSSRLDHWPTDQTFYLDLTKQLFPGPPEAEYLERRQRFVNLLREFLCRDGRTFDALMYIADRAVHDSSEYGSNGINALAGIWSYLICDGKTSMSNAALIEAFERLAETACLAHNATNCRNVVLDRQAESGGDSK